MQTFITVIFCYTLLCLSNFVELPLWSYDPINQELLTYDYRLLYIVTFIISISFRNNYAIFAVLLYLVSGLAGLPIFAFGGGVKYIFEPSFGYLLGLIPLSLLAFYAKVHIPEIGVRTFRERSVLPLMGLLVAHGCGLLYLLITQRLDLSNFASMSLYQIFYDLFFAHLVIIAL